MLKTLNSHASVKGQMMWFWPLKLWTLLGMLGFAETQELSLPQPLFPWLWAVIMRSVFLQPMAYGFLKNFLFWNNFKLTEKLQEWYK